MAGKETVNRPAVDIPGVAGPRFTVDLSFNADDGVFYAECPDLQGCHTFGDTEEDALANLTDVLLDHLDARLRNSIPEQLAKAHAAAGGADHRHRIELTA